MGFFVNGTLRKQGHRQKPARALPVRGRRPRAVRQRHGTIDVLVNNAGFNGKAQLVADMKTADWNYPMPLSLGWNSC
jgi:NADP-dependent 3-hydroxy acid dehydrogenase YdfG